MAQLQQQHATATSGAAPTTVVGFADAREKPAVRQLPLATAVGLHLLPGACMALFFILTAPRLVQAGLPPVWGLLVGALLIIVPFELGILLYTGKQLTGRLSLRGSVVYRDPLALRQYLWLVPLVVLASFLLPGLVVLLEPFIRATLFGWLPTWFVAGPGQITAYPPAIRVVTLGLWIISMVIVGPAVEELYFRGYLLPRIARFKAAAPLFNVVLFALYHFWQPYAFLTITLFALPFAYVVWWKRNVYLSIIAHCTINFILCIGLFSGVFSR